MQTMLQKYARLAIRKGVNVQKGQPLIINASVEALELTRACVEEAYCAGASRVQVFYQDEHISRSGYLYQQEKELSHIYPWEIDCRLDLLKEGACILHILSELPGIMKGVDASKISRARMARSAAGKELQEYTMANKTQWCIIAAPNKEWADMVFPEAEDAEEELWKHIYAAVHVTEENDPVEAWNRLNESFRFRMDKLNSFRFDTLHFTNSLGTDLQVGLVRNHIWAGGSEKTVDGVEFNPNMSTEELFTMPQRDGVHGIVYASRPLVYNGVLIRDFWLRFKDGKVVEAGAKAGKEALDELLRFDEGSSYLGEVALVPYDSPISKSGVLFYNTLFDENASCALGDAYPMNVKNGTRMSKEELYQAGANASLTHVDFMFGTKDMRIAGSRAAEEILLFENGNFTF